MSYLSPDQAGLLQGYGLGETTEELARRVGATMYSEPLPFPGKLGNGDEAATSREMEAAAYCRTMWKPWGSSADVAAYNACHKTIAMGRGDRGAAKIAGQVAYSREQRADAGVTQDRRDQQAARFCRAYWSPFGDSAKAAGYEACHKAISGGRSQGDARAAGEVAYAREKDAMNELLKQQQASKARMEAAAARTVVAEAGQRVAVSPSPNRVPEQQIVSPGPVTETSSAQAVAYKSGSILEKMSGFFPKANTGILGPMTGPMAVVAQSQQATTPGGPKASPGFAPMPGVIQMPQKSWFLPVAIGAGVLLLLGVGYMAIKE